MGLRLVEVAAAQAMAHSDMVQARYGPALRRLMALDAMSTADATPSSQMFALGDRVEAAVRTGDLEVARQGLDRLQNWVDSTGNANANAIALRCRALLGDGDAGLLFSQSVAAHPQGDAPLELARTRLLYGEWLRRQRRRQEARDHLRAASEAFERLGCGPLAVRAREELRATGETMRSNHSDGLASLTPQEARDLSSRRRGRPTATRPPSSISALEPLSITCTRSSPSSRLVHVPSSRTSSRTVPAEAGAGAAEHA